MSEGPNIGFQFPHFRGLDTKQASEQAGGPTHSVQGPGPSLNNEF